MLKIVCKGVFTFALVDSIEVSVFRYLAFFKETL